MARTEADATRFATEDDSLAHVLRDRPLDVPIYQRSFSWTLDQVGQFWDDLKAAQSLPDPEYFMGTLVLTQSPSGRLTVIDGQQRLATTAMLLACFRDYFLSVKDSNRAQTIERDYLASRSLRSGELEPRLKLNRDDAAYFKALVIETNESSPEAIHESNIRIEKAYRYLTKKVRDEVKSAGPNWSGLIFRWIEFLENRVKVIVVRVGNDADAFLIFETLNDRGLALTIADLLKNYLFGLAGSEIGEVENAWLNMVASFEAPTDEEALTTFLRHYWGSLHGATRERDLYRKIRAGIKSSMQTIELVGDLERSAPNYAALMDARNPQWKAYPGVQRREVDSLLRFGLEQYRPLALAAMDAWNETELRRLLRSLVNWSLRGLVTGGIGGGTTERYYSETAVLVRTGRISSAEGVFDSLAPIIVTDEAFRDSFVTRRMNNNRLTKYLLSAIDRHMSGSDDAAYISDVEESEVGLERIVSLRAHPSDWGEFEESEIGQWAFRIGNAVLVDRDATLRASAAEWPSIRAKLLMSPFLTSRLAAESTWWGPDAIAARQAEHAEIAPVVWPRRAA